MAASVRSVTAVVSATPTGGGRQVLHRCITSGTVQKELRGESPTWGFSGEGNNLRDRDKISPPTT